MPGGPSCNPEGSNMVVSEGLPRIYTFHGCMVLGTVAIALLVAS